MSNMIPNREVFDSLVCNMEMRTCESDRTVRKWMLDEASFIAGERTAMVSAIKAEEINRREKLMFGREIEHMPTTMSMSLNVIPSGKLQSKK